MEQIRLGDIFEKDFVSFDMSGKTRNIIFNNRTARKLGEGVFSFVNISDEELAFYDSNREDLISYLSNADENEAAYQRQKFIDRYINLHPYFAFFDPSVTCETLVETKRKILELLIFCLDKDFDEKLIVLSAIERYYIFRFSNRGSIPFTARPKIALMPNVIDTDKYALFLKPLENFKAHNLWDWKDNREPQPLTDELIAFVKEQKPSLYEAYEICNPADLLYLELFKMIECNNLIRLCKRCGIYFTLKGNYPAIYCDRIRPGHKKNCQDEAAKEKEARKLKEESAEKLYTRLKMRMLKRVKDGSLSDGCFEHWETEANRLFLEYIADKDADYDTFKDRIEEISK